VRSTLEGNPPSVDNIGTPESPEVLDLEEHGMPKGSLTPVVRVAGIKRRHFATPQQ